MHDEVKTRLLRLIDACAHCLAEPGRLNIAMADFICHQARYVALNGVVQKPPPARAVAAKVVIAKSPRQINRDKNRRNVKR